ncbi:MAG TPA: beta-ketoacyl synthase N-terminal-like domain-containing protein [Candidatus Binatia bacterium]|nr:beta-ketoacyl synthase N-terminal-like domain-containing protein [Candidatus Binatia bacterium]
MIPVAVTGIGVVNALGHGVEPFWRGLVAGTSGLRPIRRFAAGDALGGEVTGLDARTLVRTPVGRRIDRVSLMALAACRLALADAGLAADAIAPARTGLGLGSAFGNLGETVIFVDRLIARGAGNPLLFPNLVFNAPLSYVSIELGITGPTTMVSALEASGEAAIAWGAERVAAGAVDVCLAGGTDELDPTLHEVLRDGGLLARGPARPFDRAADGVVPGEGGAVLVLEPVARARARNARVYARIVPQPGFGVPAPVHGWPEDPTALAEGLAAAAADADAVFAAASGRPELDALEAAALAATVGEGAAVTAVRGAIGDFGAAGAHAAAAAACAISDGVVPPTVGLVPPARAGLDVVTGSARRRPLRVALVNGIARGGLCRPLRLEAV